MSLSKQNVMGQNMCSLRIQFGLSSRVMVYYVSVIIVIIIDLNM